MVEKKGRIPWNKGLNKEIDERVAKYAKTKEKYELRICPNCGGKFKWNLHRDVVYCCVGCYKEHVKGIRRSPNTEFKKGMTGELSPAYKHGQTSELKLLRYTEEGIKWRKECMVRDNFTCQICEQVGGTLNVHHIKSFVHFEEERYNIDNGITLCKECHSDIHKKYGYSKTEAML